MRNLLSNETLGGKGVTASQDKTYLEVNKEWEAVHLLLCFECYTL